MTLRYRYNQQYVPPAPMIMVRFVSPIGLASSPIPALMDSGADRTVIPVAVAETLNLQKGREVEIGGVGGTTIIMASYYVSVCIHEFAPVDIEVLSTSGERHALLGRDVLNRFRVVLDGPHGILEIGQA